jgi:hypothetical protein
MYGDTIAVNAPSASASNTSGVHQKRLIATSALEYGNGGRWARCPTTNTPLTCTIEQGVLPPRRPLFPT